jgi:hypothetical protein
MRGLVPTLLALRAAAVAAVVATQPQQIHIAFAGSRLFFPLLRLGGSPPPPPLQLFVVSKHVLTHVGRPSSSAGFAGQTG